MTNKAQVDASSLLSKDTALSEGCIIGAGVRTEGEIRLGRDVWIRGPSVIYGPADLGEGSYVDSNVVIGYPPKKKLEEQISRKSSGVGDRVAIGKNVVLRSNCTVYSGVTIGDNVTFGHNVMLREDVRIGPRSMIGTNVVIDGSSSIGKRVSIQTGVYVCTNSTVEDYVFLGPRCVFTNDKYIMQRKYELRGPTVKKGASVGANAVLLPGITVGEGAVIGAGAVVTKNVPKRAIVVGTPAKVIKQVPDEWRSLLEGKP